MSWFFKQKKQQNPSLEKKPLSTIKVVISGATDGISVAAKDVLKNSLDSVSFLKFSYENVPVFENFSDIDNRNFFDFWEKGVQILKHHQADLLLRFDQGQNQIRLSFQTEDMYQNKTVPFFSLSNNLYLPIMFFENESLPPQISALIVATILSFCLKKDERYLRFLKQIMTRLQTQALPKGIGACYMSHILVFLILNYLALQGENFTKQDMNLVLNLVEAARKNLSETQDPMTEGMIYAAQGQIYQCAALSDGADVYVLTGLAIKQLKKAQKFFNRYIYPYDYGRLCLVLSKLYQKLFNLSGDNQALRDAIAELRAAEQIFTFAITPFVWAEIEGELGSSFSILSSCSNNEDIALLAVKHQKEQQKVYVKEKYPEKWADIEKEKADIYFHLGKRIEREDYLEKAIDLYHQVFDVYQNLHKDEKASQLEKCVLRADEEIMRIFSK